MNETTPIRPSKVKKSKIRPKLKPIVSPTYDNDDDEGFGLGYGEWTPSKRRQQLPENDTPKKDERCDTLKQQSESNEEIRTDNAMSNASDDISLTKTRLSFDSNLKLSERNVADNEKENRANDCVSQVTITQKLNEGNKSKCVDGVWIESESTCSLLRSRVWQGFVILLCIAAMCISIVIKYRLSHVESSNISDTPALDKELSYDEYNEESNSNISKTGRGVLPITKTVEESIINETSSLLDEQIQDASEIEVNEVGSEEMTTPVNEDTKANASETDELVKEVENEEVSLLRETQDAPEIEKQFQAGQEASSVLYEEVTQDVPTKNEQVELEPVPDVAMKDDNQDITTLQKEFLSLLDEVDQGIISVESDQGADMTLLNLSRDEEPKMKLGTTRSDEERNHSDNSMIPSGDEELESDSDELPEINFVEVDPEASDDFPDTSFARSKEIKGVNKPLPNINALPENVESHEQDYANPKLWS